MSGIVPAWAMAEAQPVMLWGQASLTAGQGGVVMDAAKLISPYRGPMLIDTIGFKVDVSGTGPAAAVQLGGSLRVRLQMGRIALTGEKPVPMWSFGPAIQAMGELVPVVSGGTITLTATAAYYRWRLPEPLFVPAGAIIMPTFYRGATASAQNTPGSAQLDALNVIDSTKNALATITYRGLRLPPNTPQPRYINAPFVTAWVDDAGAATPGMSAERDLVNPFLVPLRVERFVGRIDGMLANGATSKEYDYLGVNCNVRIRSSTGYDVVGLQVQQAGDNSSGGAPFNSVFDRLKREFRFNGTLGSKERYNVMTFNKNTGDLGTLFTYVNPMISIVGTRREELAL